MEYIVGIVLALAVCCFARWVGLARDRAFYPTMVIVVASYYVLFAVMGGSTRALIVDSIVAAVFVLTAAVGFKTTPWLVAAGLAAHGVLDLFHGAVAANPGVPVWWPGFCSAFDVAAAGFLAWTLLERRASRV